METVWFFVLVVVIALVLCGGAFAAVDTVSLRQDGPDAANRHTVTSHRAVWRRARRRRGLRRHRRPVRRVGAGTHA